MKKKITVAWIIIAIVSALIMVYCAFYVAAIMDGGNAIMAFSTFKHIFLAGLSGSIFTALTYNRMKERVKEMLINKLSSKAFNKEEDK